MKVFIGHSSEKDETALAERIATSLRSEGHMVFFDRTDLPAAETYDQQIREAIKRSDLFLLLLSPNSIRPGSYTLSELALARNKWPDPTGHVLPVMVVPTPIDSIPSYVRAVTFLEPKGDKVAEVAAHIATLRRRRPYVQRLSIVTALAVAVVALVVLFPELWRPAKVVLVDSEARRHVLDEMALILKNIASVKIEKEPIESDWLQQADGIAKMSPSIIVIHFHALRSDKTEHYQSEVDLLLGLSKIRAVEPKVRFVLFSSGFTNDGSDNKKQILEAVERICRSAPGERADMEKVVARIRTTPWTEKPSAIEKKALSDLILELRKGGA